MHLTVFSKTEAILHTWSVLVNRPGKEFKLFPPFYSRFAAVGASGPLIMAPIITPKLHMAKASHQMR